MRDYDHIPAEHESTGLWRYSVQYDSSSVGVTMEHLKTGYSKMGCNCGHKIYASILKDLVF